MSPLQQHPPDLNFQSLLAIPWGSYYPRIKEEHFSQSFFIILRKVRLPSSTNSFSSISGSQCIVKQRASSSGKWASDLLVAFLSLEGNVSILICLWYPRCGSQCTESLQKRGCLFWWHHPFWLWGFIFSPAEFPLQVVLPECTDFLELELCQRKSRRRHWRNVLSCIRPAFSWCLILYQEQGHTHYSFVGLHLVLGYSSSWVSPQQCSSTANILGVWFEWLKQPNGHRGICLLLLPLCCVPASPSLSAVRQGKAVPPENFLIFAECFGNPEWEDP